MKRLVITLFLFLIALMGAGIASLNAGEVVFDYYFSSVTLPLAVLIFVVLCFGALAGVLLSFGLVLKIRHDRSRLRKRLKLCEQEIKNLRELPIKGPY